MSTREKRLAYLAWITICIVWGTTFLAIRVALESLPVALLAGFRWMAAGLALTLLLPLFGEVLPGRRRWRSIALVGFLMNVLGNGLVVWAQQYVASRAHRCRGRHGAVLVCGGRSVDSGR